MFNLNESNQFFFSNAPTDMRVGVNSMCGKVRQSGRNPTDGMVYVFVGKSRKVMKLLHWERGGYVVYYKRLETGRFSPRLFVCEEHTGFRRIRWDELVLKFQYLCSMEKQLTYEELKREFEELRAEARRKDERIAYLERMLFGSRRDKAPKADSPTGPTLFDEFFQKACDEKDKAIEKAREQIDKEAQARRNRKPARSQRPSEYRYAGLEERWHTEMPKDINPDDYDVIGKDVTRTLHRDPARFWVECTERPVLRLKADRNAVHPKIVQAPAPASVIGGNHVGADVLAQIVIDKYAHHLPEYRQVKMLGEMGVVLPVSTVNHWVHATADKLYPLYESLGENIRSGDYLQIDEIP